MSFDPCGSPPLSRVLKRLLRVRGARSWNRVRVPRQGGKFLTNPVERRLGKLHPTPGLQALPGLLGVVVVELLVTSERHHLAAAESESLTRDLFDQLIIAQSQV